MNKALTKASFHCNHALQNRLSTDKKLDKCNENIF